jgi:hypothetical protein
VFRRAIEHYSLYLHGYYCVGYNYKKVCENLLPPDLRSFLGKLLFNTMSIKKRDLKWQQMKLSECNVIHVIILALEAKNKVQMIYLMKSIEDELKKEL